jgi:hypothetical protein
MKAQRLQLFAGPTLSRAREHTELSLDDVDVRPPVVRGDVARLIADSPPGRLAIVDGYFHLHNLSVGHAELREAVSAGWQVWGLSSMGALRAAEMHQLGVRGFGRVFEMYRDRPDLRDDEVALLHGPDEPYPEVTEPLIHIRVALPALVEAGGLDDSDAGAVLAELMGMWFGERSLARVRELVLARPSAVPATVDAWIAELPRHRIKVLDLVAFLRERPFSRDRSPR